MIAILSVAATIAIPTFSSAEAKYLDIAANDLAQAIRFARSEAIRTNVPHGINLDSSDTRLRLYSYSGTASYTVYHPIDSQLYEINYESLRNPVSVASKAIKFQDLSINFQSNISFAAGSGVPGSSSAGSSKVLEYADFVLEYGVHQRTVSLSAMGGRVTVQ